MPVRTPAMTTACLALALLLTMGLAPTRAADAPVTPARPGDFAQAGRPFIAKHCLSCHDDRKKKGGLNLAEFKDETAVLKSRKGFEIVLKMVHAGEMPPEGRPRPTLAEIEAFTAGIRGVFERQDQSGVRDPGHVTLRRLNRTEYANTIRDLVGIDFDPAADFPSDDVGYGFDNIGDVLSLSPLLLERYLAAAETIAQRAIALEPIKPALRPTAAIFIRPRLGRGEFSVREITTGEAAYITHKISEEGNYIFRVKGYGEPKDGQVPKLALQLDDKTVRTVEVAAVRGKAASYEVKLALKPGEVKVGVVLLNPSTGDKPRGVSVQRFELEGPLDTYPAVHRKLMACNKSAPPREQAREILTRFATRAFRRPAAADEVERLLQLVDASLGRGERFEAAIQLAMQAVLVSPKFLFRVELDDRPDSPLPHPIDEYALASRLSYFLWSTMPDEELSALAAKNQLTANLPAQVRRMLQDPRSRALVDNFAMQWLQLRPLKTHAPDAKLFPTFDDKLRAAMLRETELFFEAVLREDRSILDLVDADFTFLNARLARHYGIQDTAGNKVGGKVVTPGKFFREEEFVRVKLQDGERGGLLTQASVLTATSNPTRTSPVKRGRWVLEQILGTPPPPPPPNVPPLDNDPKAQLTGSLRQRMEQHRVDPGCANCHAKLDPMGFGFENYDAIGAFRTKDGGFPVDASGTLPDGQTFQGPADLKKLLKAKKDLFGRCLAEKMLTYALGRGVEYYDKPALDAIGTRLDRNDYRFSALVTGIVTSDPFRLRRGKELAK